MFYTFNQNNSGGSFQVDEFMGISNYVIVEATSVDHANEIAESIGLYFEGCYSGMDCPCCGDRWYPVASYDEDQVPSIYGNEVRPGEAMPNRQFSIKWVDGPEGYIHYLDGRILAFWSEMENDKQIESSK